MQTRNVSLLVLLTSAVYASAAAGGPAPSTLPAGRAKVKAAGTGFVLQELRSGAKAFSNRDYVWSGVPKELEGWRYTKTAGGVPPKLRATAETAGVVWVAVTADRMLDLKEQGWTLPFPARTSTFSYSDKDRTLMILMSREVKAGQALDIPQHGWPGTLLLLPRD